VAVTVLAIQDGAGDAIALRGEDGEYRGEGKAALEVRRDRVSIIQGIHAGRVSL
jgi:hypothetical protein